MRLKFPFTITDSRLYKSSIGRCKKVEQNNQWGCNMSLLPVFHFWHSLDRYLDDGPSGSATYSWGITMRFLIWTISIVEYQRYTALYREPWIEDVKGKYLMTYRECQQESIITT